MDVAPPKNKFQVRREATHQALLDAGMRAYAERGYAATRVEDIVARTGHTKGAFYFHFENKLALLRAVIRYRAELRGEWGRLPAEMDRELSLAQVLEATLTEVRRRLGGVGGWVLVMVDAHRQHQDDPDVRALFEEDYERWIDEATDLVDTLKRCGWTASTVPSRRLATALFALGEGFDVHAGIYGLDDASAIFDGYATILEA